MGRVLVLTFAFLCRSTPSPAAPPAPPADIEWKRALVIGFEARKPAANQPLVVEGERLVHLGLVLEGTRAQLPVYCSPFLNLRIDGRAIADRLVLTPENAGLADADVQWTALRPEASKWQRTPIDAAKNQWTLDVQDFPVPEVPGIPASQGTLRFAAAIRAPGKKGKLTLFESPGFSPASTAKDSSPEGPGLRVSRAGGYTLAGQAFALARIPVRADAQEEDFLGRTALRPVDLVLGAIESQGKVTLPTPRGTPLSSEDWSWLLQPIRRGIHRRSGASSPLVDATGRPIPNRYQTLNGTEPVKPGDVIGAGDGQYAILEEDDGDQWLGEGDRIVHTVHGEVRRGRISELPGESIDVLRPRSFLQLRADLKRAGYGGIERASPLLSSELLKSVRDFQRDRRLKQSGVPDSTTLTALHEVLQKLEPPDGAAKPSSPDSTSAHAAPR